MADKTDASRTPWKDRRTRARFVRVLKAFMASEVGGRARRLAAVIVSLLIAVNALNILNSYVGRDFMTALAGRQVATFFRQALLYVGVFAASTLVDVFLRYAEETLALVWREWLTRWMVARYLRPPVYHRISDRLIAGGDIPNPDQRIADDVRAFTASSLGFLLMVVNGTFTIIAFSGVMISIRPALFLVGLLYAAAGSLLAIRWGRPLVRLNVTQLDREADFRYELIHVRENADALAIARREDRLYLRLMKRLADLVENFRRIIKVNRNLAMFTTAYNYLMQIVPTLIVAPLFIRGEVEFGVVTQSAMAFAQLVGAFSLLITQFQSISAYAAVVTRLGVLDEAIEEAQAHPVPASEVCRHHERTSTCPVCSKEPLPATAISVESCGEECGVSYENLTLLSASEGRVLTRDLAGTISPKSRLLIIGPNEEAKGALFRATAGTWDRGSGRILRPGDERMLFLPERPYLPPGTLREVLTRVEPGSTLSEDEILAAVRAMDLEAVIARVGGLDVERRWASLLTLGEQQSLAFAHILVSNPRTVFLERPGTALGPEALNLILELLVDRSVTVLTIARPRDSRAHYTSILTLDEDGGWDWKPHAPS